MASAIKCDRCGYTSVRMSEFRNLRIHRFESPTEYSQICIQNLDLCVNCLDKLLDSRNNNEEDLNDD